MLTFIVFAIVALIIRGWGVIYGCYRLHKYVTSDHKDIWDLCLAMVVFTSLARF